MSNKDPVNQLWDQFWKRLVCGVDGSVNMEKVKAELHDYYMLLENTPKVYSEITGGATGNPFVDPNVIIELANTHYETILHEGEGHSSNRFH